MDENPYKRPDFVKVPISLIDDKELSATAKAVYMYLLSITNWHGMTGAMLKEQFPEAQIVLNRAVEDLDKGGYLGRVHFYGMTEIGNKWKLRRNKWGMTNLKSLEGQGDE